MKWEVLVIAAILQAQLPVTGKADTSVARHFEKVCYCVWGTTGAGEDPASPPHPVLLNAMGSRTGWGPPGGKASRLPLTPAQGAHFSRGQARKDREGSRGPGRRPSVEQMLVGSGCTGQARLRAVMWF